MRIFVKVRWKLGEMWTKDGRDLLTKIVDDLLHTHTFAATKETKRRETSLTKVAIAAPIGCSLFDSADPTMANIRLRGSATCETNVCTRIRRG